MIPARLVTTRVLPIAAGVIALALVMAGLGAVVYEERAYKAKQAFEDNIQAQILAATVTAALAFEDRNEAQEYVDAMQANTDVQAVALYDNKGRLFTQYLRYGAPPPPTLAELTPSSSDNIVITQPVRQKGTQLGTVYLRIVTEPLSRRLLRYGIIAVFSAFAALVVAILALAYVAIRRMNIELLRKTDALAESHVRLLEQVSEREKAESALRQAQKMEALGQMTGGVAHDFNNLLQILNLNLSLLMWSPAVSNDSELSAAVKIGINAVQRGANLTKQLLAFGRRQPLAPKSFDVNALIKNMTPLVERSVGDAVQVRLNLAPAVWHASADANQLEHALLNLAVNARDAMPAGGTITIETGNYLQRTQTEQLSQGEYVYVAVCDTGVGINSTVLEKVFEPFFTTKDVGKGSGLGLSQVYGYVKQSGGDVRIESVENIGTTVTMLLPKAASTPAANDTESSLSEADSQFQEKTILVVEDETLLLETAITILEKMGFRVSAAANAAAALNILKSAEPIDILFSDVVLPGEFDGYQLAQQAKAMRPQLKILLTSGYTGMERRAAPKIPLLRKPYGPDELAHALRRLEQATYTCV